MIKVVVLGFGNVGHNLVNELYKADNVDLVQIFSRSKILDTKFNITHKLSELKNADIYIITISDDAISRLSDKLSFSNKLVVHTSGSVSLNELNKKNFKGVFYPLQTFSKDKQISFKDIPICIEAERDEDLKILHMLGESISNKIYKINSAQRKQLHLTAVFINNFVNHLYFIGNDICEKNDIPFEIFYPLIKETSNKIKSLSPYLSQTGPAKRNDKTTIKKHLEMLPLQYKKIYEIITSSIIETYNKQL